MHSYGLSKRRKVTVYLKVQGIPNFNNKNDLSLYLSSFVLNNNNYSKREGCFNCFS